MCYSPFRRRLKGDLMIRHGELKLGGALVHPLQAFPDGTHVYPLELCFVLQQTVVRQSFPTYKEVSLQTHEQDAALHLREDDSRNTVRISQVDAN